MPEYPLTIESFEMIYCCSQCRLPIEILAKPNQDKTDYNIEAIPLNRKTCRACRAVANEAMKKLRRLLKSLDKRAYEELHIFVNDVAKTRGTKVED